MFMTEPILWLQGWENAALTQLMTLVSLLGYTSFYVAVVLALAFGLRLRPALGVLLALLLAAVATDTLKNTFALPRPSDVDSRVSEPGDDPPQARFERGGATDFWSLPPPEAITAVRQQQGASFGLPSGHAASAAALCLAIWWCFRPRREVLLALLGAWPLLMALSRMYLGRHFLGDVLAGLALGASCAALAVLLFRPTEVPRSNPLRLAGLAALSAACTVGALSSPLFDAENVGRLLGLVVTLLALGARRFPADPQTWGQRVLRVALGGLTYLALDSRLGQVFTLAGWVDHPAGELLLALVVTAGTLLIPLVIVHIRGEWAQAAKPRGLRSF